MRKRASKVFFPDKLHNAGRVSEEAEAAEKAKVQEACGDIGHVASNDTDLPVPSDEKGKMVESWCKQGSWGMCTQCHSMQPRPLTPMDLKRVNKPTIPSSQCTACKHGEYVPQPQHVPEPLRNMKPRVLEALRPLERDIGFVERVPHGYRVHNAMMAFAWKERSVQDAIQRLDKRSDRRAARAALDCLLNNKDSAYKEIFKKHREFLNKEGENASLQKRKRPLRFIETEGLECCIWPQLYWHRNMCETVARASHENRATARAATARRRRVADTSSGEEAEAEEVEDEECNQEEDFAEETSQRTVRRTPPTLSPQSMAASSAASCARFFPQSLDILRTTSSGTLSSICRCGQPLAPRRIWPPALEWLCGTF